jgi:hypothetical protein
MTEQNIKNWLEEEANSLKQPTQFEELPALKLQPNVVVELEVETKVEWNKWIGQDMKGNTITKKIIPVVLNGVRMNWWLNVRNPLYREIVMMCAKGHNQVKVLQTGTQQNTKYVLVK